jgi:hypothetical protein
MHALHLGPAAPAVTGQPAGLSSREMMVMHDNSSDMKFIG